MMSVVVCTLVVLLLLAREDVEAWRTSPVSFRRHIGYRLRTQHMSSLSESIDLLDLNTSFGGPVYVKFPGAENITVLSNPLNFYKKSYQPTSLVDATPEASWQYWQNKQRAERQLKRAIELGYSNLVPFFNEHKVYTEVDRAEILQLNHDFYRALDHTDLHTMKSIWLDSPETICMLSYPNDIISGYDNIIAYLSAMLPASTPTEIAYTNLHFMGDVAIVTSDLRYNALKGDSSSKKKPPRPKRVISLQGYVTNIFVRSQVSGRFHLVGHYGTTKRVVHPYKNVYRDPTILPPRPKDKSNSLQSIIMNGGYMGGGDDGDEEDGASWELSADDEEEEEEDYEEEGEEDDDDSSSPSFRTNDPDTSDDDDESEGEDVDDDDDGAESPNNKRLGDLSVEEMTAMINKLRASGKFGGGPGTLYVMRNGQLVKADTNDNGKVSGKGKMSEKDRMMEALREHFARAVGKAKPGATGIMMVTKVPLSSSSGTENDANKEAMLRALDNFVRRQGDNKNTNGKDEDEDDGGDGRSSRSNRLGRRGLNRRTRKNSFDDDEDEDEDEDDEDYDDEMDALAREEESKHRAEKKLVTSSCDALLTWLETSQGRLSPEEARILRTDLISSATREVPSRVEVAFALFLCRTKPRYLGGNVFLETRQVPRFSVHFYRLQMEAADDMRDFVVQCRRVAQELMETEAEDRALFESTRKVATASSEEDESDDDSGAVTVEIASKKAGKGSSSKKSTEKKTVKAATKKPATKAKEEKSKTKEKKSLPRGAKKPNTAAVDSVESVLVGEDKESVKKEKKPVAKSKKVPKSTKAGQDKMEASAVSVPSEVVEKKTKAKVTKKKDEATTDSTQSDSTREAQSKSGRKKKEKDT